MVREARWYNVRVLDWLSIGLTLAHWAVEYGPGKATDACVC